MDNDRGSKPEWVVKLEAEPCHCVRCGTCGGSGTLYYDLGGRYVGRHMMDDMDEPESCDECRGGIIETCDRCDALDQYDAELEFAR